MPEHTLVFIVLGVLIIAFLYSSVGHAGASGYIAVMTLFSVTPGVIRPVALVLNILVASIGAWQFYAAGHFSARLFWPFAVLSIPLAFVGGYIHLPGHVFEILVGLVLLVSAARFFLQPGAELEPKPPPVPVAVAVGGGLGLLAGLTGTGGGIFLTPLIIMMGWAKVKTASAISAVFILVNSVAGLLGNLASTRQFPGVALPLLAAATAGGALGAYFGSRRFPQTLTKRLLAVVLTIAGIKLILA